MNWKNIIKAPPLTPEEEKEIQELMRFRNLTREQPEPTTRRSVGKTARTRPAVGRFAKSDEDFEDLEKFKRRFKKVVTNKKTGRKRTVKYGQAGKAKDGKDRIRPGTSKGDAYCARSNKIKGNWRSDPNSPNNLSRKKWKCHGNKSSR